MLKVLFLSKIYSASEVSISLTEMPFLILQVNFHTSNDFCDWRLLKKLLSFYSFTFYRNSILEAKSNCGLCLIEPQWQVNLFQVDFLNS